MQGISIWQREVVAAHATGDLLEMHSMCQAGCPPGSEEHLALAKAAQHLPSLGVPQLDHLVVAAAQELAPVVAEGDVFHTLRRGVRSMRQCSCGVRTWASPLRWASGAGVHRHRRRRSPSHCALLRGPWYRHKLSCLGHFATVQPCLTEGSGDLPHLGVANVGAHAFATAKNVPDLDLAVQTGGQQPVSTVRLEPAQDSAASTLHTP